MSQYYYLNKLSNENYVAKPNSVWVADITEFKLNEVKKFTSFFVSIFFQMQLLRQYLEQKQLLLLI